MEKEKESLLRFGISFKADRKYFNKHGKEAVVEHDKKSVVESIVKAIREKPDEIIHWEIEETPDRGLTTAGFIEFKKPQS